MVSILLNKKLNFDLPFPSTYNFSTSPSDYVEYTAVGANGNVYTPSEWTEFLDSYQYHSAMKFCREYWSFDLDRSFDIKDFNTVFVESVPLPSHNYTVGELCPNIDPSYTPHDCREFYRLMDMEYYFTKCFELGNTGPSNKSDPLNDIVNSSKIVHETSHLNFLDDFSSLIPNFYEVWFFVNKPLLAEEYFQIGLFLGFAIFLSVLIVTASYALVIQTPESEKLSTYECGFEPYEDAKNKFDVQFYVVAILFVLFDIEIIVMLPWCLSMSTLNILGYWSMIEFLLELGLGFVYVWCIGALDW